MPMQHGIPCYLPYTIYTEKSRRRVYLSAFTVEGLYVCISANLNARKMAFNAR
jgi:hypothetical protein